MDSLTQIVLGAAVGEAVLGRKVGNRAMLWGGIAGTLPDLDVLSSMVTDPMSALAYHRAFTHSIVFAVLAAPFLGYAVHHLYGGKYLRDKWPSWQAYLTMAIAFCFLIDLGSEIMPVEVYHVEKIAGLITLVIVVLFLLVGLRQRLRKRASSNGNASFAGWTLLFFLAIATHPMLDCFTAYGTQIFQPLSKLRVGFNTISVVDPFYTLPFLLLLLLAARKGAGSRVRRKLNMAGLVLSSVYLLFTVVNYFNVEAVLEDSLADRNIVAEATVQGPTIGNNILWTATARTVDKNFYVGQYSLLDSKREFGPFVEIQGHHEWLLPFRDDREVQILEWFTNGNYVVIPRDSGYLQVSDLRYGLTGDDPYDPASYIFNWKIDTTLRPVRVMQDYGDAQRDGGRMLGNLWERLKGR